MSRMSRRAMLSASASCGAALLGGPAFAAQQGRPGREQWGQREQPGRQPAQQVARWIGAGPLEHVYDPSPAGGPKRYLNDHCTIQAPDGTWHLFSIIGDSAPPGEFPNGGLEDNIAHATAPDPRGPWTTQPHVLTVDPDYGGEDHLWAPHVIEHEGTYYMYYSAGGDGAAINLATSTDLFEWTRIPSGPLFRGRVARDTMLLRIGDQWVMYYCEINDQGHHIVAARTSTDLLAWSAPQFVYTDPVTDASASVTESPYVVERDGWWYLFIGPRNGYVGTDVYASQDPFAFRLENYAGHVPAHCTEIIRHGDEWLISAAGSFQDGLYIAPLHWRTAPPLWHSPHNPAVALDVTGQLMLFALAADRTTLVARTLTGAWETFGSDFATVPTVGAHADGRLVAFGLRPDGMLAARSQQPDGAWTSWQDMGGPLDATPAVARDVNGRLHLFALGHGGQNILHMEQLAPDANDWSGWETFGTAAGAPPVIAANDDGRLEVIALGPGGAYLAHRWQNTPGGDWHDWDASFGTPAGMVPSLVRDGRGLLHAIALAPVGTGLFIRTQSAPSNGWAAWQQWGPWADTPPTVVANADGRLEAFFTPPGGRIVFHRYQNGDGSWAAQQEFGPGPVSSTPSAGIDADGRIHVFAVAPDGTVRTRVQTAPNSGWGEWQPMDGEPIAPVPAGSAT